jgi:polar amino acid transport system substrate-binding protein
MKLLTFTAGRLFLVAVLVSILGCGGGEKEQRLWIAGEVLRVGTDATYPPFEMVNTETGWPEGFDIDIMNAICRINGWQPEYIVTPFDGIISGLKSNKYDCIISAMTITPQREAIVSFTRPYYLAGQVVAVSVDDTLIKSVDDLKGRRVGVQLGTTGERMAKGLAGVGVFSFDNIGAAFIDMENGHIDAVLNDFPTTMEYIRRKGNAKVVGDLLSKEYYGIAVRMGNSELLKRIDSALAMIEESGEYDRIERKWFQSALSES